MASKHTITIENTFGSVEKKKVTVSGNSGRVIVPRHWVGGEVTVVLTKQPEKRSEPKPTDKEKKTD
jgi:putative transposon-encoded protein